MKFTVTLLLFVTFNGCFGQTAKEYFDRGNSKALLRDYDGAISDYAKAIEMNPKLTEAYFYRGLLKVILLDQKESGCLDLSKAVALGDERAVKAMKEHCQSKVEPKDSEEEASFGYQTSIRTENYGRNN